MKYQIKFVLIFLILAGLFILIYVTKKHLNEFIKNRGIEIHRRKTILQLFCFSYYILFVLLSALILGISIVEFVVFFSSILAVIGVGFFAQWSILSNLTAAIILFFNHPIRIGNKIQILDIEFGYCGKVLDITNFYVLLENENDKSLITIPNTVILYKGVKVID